MPKKAKTPYPYPNPIPEFQGNPERNLNAVALHEYFIIETLIRTETAFQAYTAGGMQALKALFKSRGILGQEPLSDSHHKLLKPSEQRENSKKSEPPVYIDGHIDTTLTIRDLGVLMMLPAHTPIPVEQGGQPAGRFISGSSGEEQCLYLLRNRNPRFLYLQIDVSEGSTRILKNERLRDLLNERHAQYKKMPVSPQPSFYRRLQKPPVVHFEKWFKYFKCRDLNRIQGLKPPKLAQFVYENLPTPAKAMATATQALDRAEQAISAAEGNNWQKNWPPIIKY